jgi:hypothetical protein
VIALELDDAVQVDARVMIFETDVSYWAAEVKTGATTFADTNPPAVPVTAAAEAV